MFIGNKLLSPLEGWQAGCIKHTDTHIHIYMVAHCLAHLHALTVRSSQTGYRGLFHAFCLVSPNTFLFLSLISLPVFLCLYQMVFISESLCLAFCTSSACWLHLFPIRVLLKYTETDTHHMDLHTIGFICSHGNPHLYKCMQKA